MQDTRPPYIFSRAVIVDLAIAVLIVYLIVRFREWMK